MTLDRPAPSGGQTAATVQVHSSAVIATALTASTNGTSSTARLRVQPVPLAITGLTLSQTTALPGGRVNAYLTLTRPAPSFGGVTVDMSGVGLRMVPDETMSNTDTSILNCTLVGEPGTDASLTASYGGVTKTLTWHNADS